MKLFYRPVSPWRITQKFGANQTCVDNATSTKTIACDGLNPPTGYRSAYSLMRGHNGLDLQAARWQPVYAAREGVVVEVSTEPERGLGVGIAHDFGTYGRWKTRYWHFIALNIHVGDHVSTGELIGYADSTGYSTADHLHFEVKRITADGANVYQDNGYFGAEDPEPLMFDIPAVEVNKLRLTIETIRTMLQGIIDRMGAIKTHSA